MALKSKSIHKFFHCAIYVGPFAFLSGILIALLGEFTRQPEMTLTGLIFSAAGLLIWGCHGMRRRGKRPGFVLMSALGSAFFTLHLYYRFSDYRWAKINTLVFESAPSATLAHLESRVVLFLSIFLLSALLGLLPPLPAANSPRKVLSAND